VMVVPAWSRVDEATVDHPIDDSEVLEFDVIDFEPSQVLDAFDFKYPTSVFSSSTLYPYMNVFCK